MIRITVQLEDPKAALIAEKGKKYGLKSIGPESKMIHSRTPLIGAGKLPAMQVENDSDEKLWISLT